MHAKKRNLRLDLAGTASDLLFLEAWTCTNVIFLEHLELRSQSNSADSLKGTSQATNGKLSYCYPYSATATPTATVTLTASLFSLPYLANAPAPAPATPSAPKRNGIPNAEPWDLDLSLLDGSYEGLKSPKRVWNKMEVDFTFKPREISRIVLFLVNLAQSYSRTPLKGQYGGGGALNTNPCGALGLRCNHGAQTSLADTLVVGPANNESSRRVVANKPPPSVLLCFTTCLLHVTTFSHAFVFLLNIVHMFRFIRLNVFGCF